MFIELSLPVILILKVFLEIVCLMFGVLRLVANWYYYFLGKYATNFINGIKMYLLIGQPSLHF